MIHHSKIWLATQDDLQAMYAKYPTGPITLWCDSRSTDEDGDSANWRVPKRRKVETSSNRQDKKVKLMTFIRTLKSKHGEKYSTPKLCLWARMVTANLH